MAKFEVTIDVKEGGKRPPLYSLKDDMNGEFTMKDLQSYLKGTLIAVSENAREEEQEKGFDRKPRVLVDNRPGRSLFDVSPFGRIEYIAREDISEIITFAFDEILKYSKVDTGQYKASNVVVFNGVPVATDKMELQAWIKNKPIFQDKDRIRIVNVAPYARKLEYSGISSKGTTGRQWSKKTRKSGKKRYRVMIPNGAYTIATRSIKNKYKKNADIKYQHLTGAELGGIPGKFKTGKKNQINRPYLYPTILISIQESGILQ